MSRRQVSTTRRFVDSGNFPFAGALQSKSRSSPILSIGLFIVGAILLIGYVYSGSGILHISEVSCFGLLVLLFNILISLAQLIDHNKAYGDNMHKVLHMGPDTCLVVSKLLKEEGTEAWGVEPYDIEDVEADCKSLVGKGIVRVADIKFPLPYRSKSFSIVIVSDAIDYLSPKYLNKTLPEFARLASDGLVIFAGSPGHQKAEVAELSKFGRPAKMRSSTWWVRFFDQISLQGNEAVTKKFEQAASKSSFLPACQVFHLKPYH
ncbi:GTP-binding protein [Hibiscus syriacus]|uniref:GTP-binding protein n=1 Tax=Hibiscus syriacus TaxID=106335 RepID=A0A6A3AYI1_HIBSY|nr:GTP-binding protein [Hibiscus syriacus]